MFKFLDLDLGETETGDLVLPRHPLFQMSLKLMKTKALQIVTSLGLDEVWTSQTASLKDVYVSRSRELYRGAVNGWHVMI